MMFFANSGIPRVENFANNTEMPSRSEISTRSEVGILTEMMIIKDLVKNTPSKTFVFCDDFHLGNNGKIIHSASDSLSFDRVEFERRNA